MSIFESCRKMTPNESMCYDMGFKAGNNYNNLVPHWTSVKEKTPDCTFYWVYEENSKRVLLACLSEWEAADWNVTYWQKPIAPEPPNQKNL